MGQALVKWTLLVYAIPLVALIGGVGISYYFLERYQIRHYESLAFGLGLVLMLLSALVLRALDHRFQKDKDFLKLEKK